MKYLLLLFCSLPIFGFGQSDSIRVDSVSLVSFSGVIPRYIKPKPKKSLMRSISVSDDKYSLGEQKMTEEKRLKKYIEKYPNYKPERDMPYVRTNTILDSKSRFHPTTKWETYRTFPLDSVEYLLDILSCDIPKRDTTYTINENGEKEMTIRFNHNHSGGAMCFAPGLGVLVWSEGEVYTFYSVCLKCNRVHEGTNDGYARRNKRCVLIHLIKEEAKRFGYYKEEE